MSYEAALFAHLVGALIFVAGMAVAGAALLAARRRRQAGEIAALLRLARWGVLLVAAGAALLLVFGFWLVELTPWSLADGWLGWALALFLASAVLGALGGRRPKRARLEAERLAPDAEAPEELLRLLRDPVSDALNAAAAALAVVVLALMVWKP
ncbi:MAG TPA: DUF2269 family protein [Gaiellaceae bacterium]|nr:DUF2269 family protein [Gaiellaceae bacterium]